MITVRHFAAAAEAAGTHSETIAARTLGELRAILHESHGPGMERVLSQASLLAAGHHIEDDATELIDGTTVDVLPPFAGG